MPIELQLAYDIDPGKRRAYNQDNAMALTTTLETGSLLGLLVVADGVGGQKAGDVASRLTIEAIEESIGSLFRGEGDLSDTQKVVVALAIPSTEDRLYKFMETRLNMAIQLANQRIREYAEANPEEAGNMRSTVTCALIFNKLLVVGNVGDSRTYLLRNGVLQQITADHSVVGQLVRDGQLAPEEVFTHPRRNVITRALGNQEAVEADYWHYELADNDLLLLCSDGLWEMVTSDTDKVALLASTPDLNEVVRVLIDAANQAGGEDNISVVLARVRETLSNDYQTTMPEFDPAKDLPTAGTAATDTLIEFPAPPEEE